MIGEYCTNAGGIKFETYEILYYYYWLRNMSIYAWIEIEIEAKYIVNNDFQFTSSSSSSSSL